MRTGAAVALGVLGITSCSPFQEASEPGTDAGDAATGTDAGDAAAPQSLYAQAVLADRPLLYWRLGDPTGERVARDLSGKDRHGAFEGPVFERSASLLKGDPDTAVEVRASGSIATKAAGLEFAGRGTFSLECWYRINTKSGRSSVLLSRMVETTGLTSGYGIWLDESGLPFMSRYEGTANSGGANQKANADVALGVAHHVVGVFDDKGIYIWFDGVKSTTTWLPEKLVARDLAFAVGRYDNRPATLEAFVDEVAVYDYALPDERVRAHYELGKPDGS